MKTLDDVLKPLIENSLYNLESIDDLYFHVPGIVNTKKKIITLSDLDIENISEFLKNFYGLNKIYWVSTPTFVDKDNAKRRVSSRVYEPNKSFVTEFNHDYVGYLQYIKYDVVYEKYMIRICIVKRQKRQK